MSTIALFSGLVALLAGLAKYAIDAYTARQHAPGVSLTVGNQSIQVPNSYTPEQVAAVVTLLKDKAATEQQTR